MLQSFRKSSGASAVSFRCSLLNCNHPSHATSHRLPPSPQALVFLHGTCRLVHGNLGLHALFVAPSGDWKLAALDLTCDPAKSDDLTHFLKYQALLGPPYSSPERLQLPSSSSANPAQLETLSAKLPQPPAHLDVYALGKCMSRAFELLGLPLPAALNKYLTAMTNEDWKKRPSAAKVASGQVFCSDHMTLLQSIDELALKSSKEAIELIAKLEPSLCDISRHILYLSSPSPPFFPFLCLTLSASLSLHLPFSLYIYLTFSPLTLSHSLLCLSSLSLS